MGWNWVSNLSLSDTKKKMYWDAHCPYKIHCPSHQPKEHSHPPKLKFVQKISPLVNQYKCKYCGCLVNISLLMADDENMSILNLNPALHGGKPSYKFNV